MTYIPWTDHYGRRLELSSSQDCAGSGGGSPVVAPRAGEGCLVITAGDFHLPLHKLGEFVATLYEVAGKPAPVVLDRPAPLGRPGDVYETELGTIRPTGTMHGETVFVVGPQECTHHLTPKGAQVTAGALAAVADGIKDAPEPDAADLWALGRILERAGVSEYHTAALAALRAGYTPPRGDR